MASLPLLKSFSSKKDFIQFFETVAHKIRFVEEDFNEIFNLQYIEPDTIEKKYIQFKLFEERPVEFKEKGPILDVFGRNQVGKTTTLLYIANLLGYDFYNVNNINFLSEDKIVNQGRNILLKLQEGMKSELILSAKDNQLQITSENGFITIKLIEKGKLILNDQYNLKTQSEAFRRLLRNLVDVKLISKGRDFLTQLLIDLLQEFNYYSDLFRERSINLNLKLRINNDHLLKNFRFQEGLNLSERKNKLLDELNILTKDYNEIENYYNEITNKYEIIKKIFEFLSNIRSSLSYKLKSELYQLKTDLDNYKKRLEILKEFEFKLDELNNNIKNKSTELNILKDDLSSFNLIINTIENILEKIITQMNREDFYNIDFFENIIKVIREKDIDAIISINKNFDLKSGDAINDIYNVVQKQDSNIKLPPTLGGSMHELQKIVEKSRENILDNIKTLEHCLILLDYFQENNITSSNDYEIIINKINDLQNEIINIQDEIEDLNMSKENITLEKDSSIIVYTKEIIRDLNNTIKEKEEEYNNIKNKKEELFNEILPLVNFISDEPFKLLYSSDNTTLLLEMRKNIEKEIREFKNKLKEKNDLLENIKNELKNIDYYLTNPEATYLFQRLDDLVSFSEILQMLINLFENQEFFIKKESYDKLSPTLEKYDISNLLESTINNILLKQCKHYYEIINDKLIINDIINLNYRKNTIEYNNKKISIDSISGGTSSVLTVLSLASIVKNTKFRTVFLIDEFNDVVGNLRDETLRQLDKQNNIIFIFIVRPESKNILTIKSIKIGVKK